MLILAATGMSKTTMPFGITWRTADLGPAVVAAAQRLAIKYPALDREHVLCQFWSWDDGGVPVPAWFLLTVGGMFLLTGIAIYGVLGGRIRKRRRQVAWWRHRLRAPAVAVTSALP